MKPLLFCILSILSISCFSQIQLDIQTPMMLTYQRLNDSEVKYIDEGAVAQQQQDQFSLYNLDGSLYKTIQLPAPPDPTAKVYNIFWISTALFDTDPSTIEYLISYYWDSIPGDYWQYVKSRIIREDGTILLDEMYAIPNSAEAPLIYNTDDGTKLLLRYQYATSAFFQTKVFSLPGNLPEGIINIPGQGGNIQVYPNPNAGRFYIKLDSKQAGGSEINLYSNSGKLINTYKVLNSPAQINAAGLPDGIYYLNSRWMNQNSTGKVIIQK